MSFPDYQGIMGKIGIKTEVVKSGRFKDTGSSTRDFSAADRELLQGVIDEVHSQFVAAISEGRNIPVDRLQPFVDGRIFTGQQALAAGLIDELGSLSEAVRYAGKAVGLGDDPKIVYPRPEEKSIFERLIQGAASRYLGVVINPHSSAGPQYLWGGY
jgi:protease-4